MWEVRNNYWVDLSRIEKDEQGRNDWKNSIGKSVVFKSDVEEKHFLITSYERRNKHKRTIYLTLLDCTGKQYEVRTMDILHGNLDSLFI